MSAHSRGALVAVAHVGSRGEAEMIQGLLEDAEVPAMVHQTGIDGPALGIAWMDREGCTHRVMVHAERLEEARALLADALAESERQGWPEAADATFLEETESRDPRGYGFVGAFIRIFAWSAVGMAGMVAIFLLSRVL